MVAPVMDAEPRLAVGVVSLLAPDLLDRCVRSLLPQRGLDMSDVAVVANGARVLGVCDYWEREQGIGLSVHRPGRNLGTCESWNRLCRWAWGRGADAALILNDDMELLEPGTLEAFAAVYREGGLRQMRFVMACGFSAVAVTRAVWDEVGEFDAGFWPAYFEDNDYWRRFTLRGILWDHVMVQSRHEGSGTLKADPQVNALNGITFSVNSDRYHAKWGGGPHHETYAEPWNGGPPRPGTRELISPEVVAKVEAAYGEADDSWR